MDYIVNLIKAQKHLLKRVKELSEIPHDFYYDKYLKLNKENLDLKEKISELESQIFTLNRELDKKNAEIRVLSNK